MMLAATLVTLTIKATLLLLATWALTRLMARRSAAARCCVWASGIGFVIVLPGLLVITPDWHLNVLPAAAVGAVRTGPAENSDAGVTAPLNDEQPARPGMLTFIAARGLPGWLRHTSAAFMANSGAIVSGLWALGFGLAGCRVAVGLISLAAIVRRAKPPNGPEWSGAVADACGALGIRTPPRVLVSDVVAMPATCGLFNPTLLVPASCRQWTAAQRRSVILHELAHVRRRDCVTQLMTECASAAYWFHPLMFLAASRLRDERERACDDVVLAAGTSAPDYADHLVDLVRPATRSWSSRPALAFAATAHLEQRLRAILDAGQRRTTPRPAAVFAGLTGAMVVVMLLGAARLSAIPTTQQVDTSAIDTAGQVVWTTRVISAETQDRAVKALALALGDISEEIRAEAHRALRRISGNARSPLVIRLDCDGNCIGHQPAPLGLDSASAEAALLHSDNVMERRAAVVNVWRDSKSGADALARALFDSDRLVRTLAAMRLDSVFTDAAIPGWIALLEDEDPSLRERAAISLGVIGDPRAIDPLTDLLKDPEIPVGRRQVVTAFATIASGPLT